jgi:hypothetical protein
MDYVQTNATTIATTVAVNNFVFDSEPTNGNLVVLVIKSGSSATFTLPAGFTVNVDETSSAQRVQIASKPYAGEGNSFTVTRSSTTGDSRITGYELPAGAEFEVGDINGGDVTSLALDAGAAAHDDSIFLTGVKHSNSVTGRTVNNSYSLDSETANPRQGTAFKQVIVGGASAVTWSWTGQMVSGAALGVYGIPGVREGPTDVFADAEVEITARKQATVVIEVF